MSLNHIDKNTNSPIAAHFYLPDESSRVAKDLGGIAEVLIQDKAEGFPVQSDIDIREIALDRSTSDSNQYHPVGDEVCKKTLSRFCIRLDDRVLLRNHRGRFAWNLWFAGASRRLR
jgi:hypothetical protein